MEIPELLALNLCGATAMKPWHTHPARWLVRHARRPGGDLVILTDPHEHVHLHEQGAVGVGLDLDHVLRVLPRRLLAPVAEVDGAKAPRAYSPTHCPLSLPVCELLSKMKQSSKSHSASAFI